MTLSSGLTHTQQSSCLLHHHTHRPSASLKHSTSPRPSWKFGGGVRGGVLATTRGSHALSHTSPVHTRAAVDSPAAAFRPEPPTPEAAASPTRASAEDDQSLLTNVPQMWSRLAQRHPDTLALSEPHNKEAQDMTYAECESVMQQAAAGLSSLGLQRSDPVALFAEASSRWILADQASMMAGGITVVRGSSASVDELSFILQSGKCQALVIQDADALRKVLPALESGKVGPLKFVVVIWGAVDASLQAAFEAASASAQNGSGQTPALLTWPQLMEQGQASLSQQPFVSAPCSPEEVATLVYTSGTTGQPTGVKLTHANLAYQVNKLHNFVEMRPGDKLLSLLPPWHIYQRTASYFSHSKASTVIFSNIRRFASDLTSVSPDHMVCVPLVLDTLYSRVMQKLRNAPVVRQKLVGMFLAISTVFIKARRIVEGVSLKYALQAPAPHVMLGARLLVTFLRPLHELATKLVWSKVREALGIRRTVISGGGSLASHLDDFFEIIGLPVLNGWGLTETSPVLACRNTNTNVRGTVGHPVPGTELRVVQPDTLEPLPAGEQGLVLARGPGITPGYVDNEAATSRAFRAGDGWFDTGDLGWQAPQGVPGSRMGGMVQLTGRSKDTIVLINGKNISPQPIEDMICASNLVKYSLLFGQDKRELGALIFPDMDALEALLAQRSSSTPQPSDSSSSSSDSSSNGSSDDGTGPTHPLAMAASQQELEDIYMREIGQLEEEGDHAPETRIARVVVVVAGSLSIEDGTLTQTMKAKKPVITAKYASHVEQLMTALRG